jgi:hypothetical protein
VYIDAGDDVLYSEEPLKEQTRWQTSQHSVQYTGLYFSTFYEYFMNFQKRDFIKDTVLAGKGNMEKRDEYM